MRDAVLAHQKRMQQIQRDGFVPDVETHFMHGHVFKYRAAGAVDQHIEFAEFCHCGVYRLLDSGILRDIGLYENYFAAGVFDFLLGAFAHFCVDVDDGDFCAFFDEFERADFGNAGAAAGEESYFSDESWHSGTGKIII